MHQPYDASRDNAWLVRAIKEFSRHDLERYDMQSDAVNNLEPSTVENTRQNWFGTKPNATQGWRLPADRFRPCPIRSEEFKLGDDFDHTNASLRIGTMPTNTNIVPRMRTFASHESHTLCDIADQPSPCIQHQNAAVRAYWDQEMT